MPSQRLRLHKRKTSGFSLVEILLVVVIISILAVLTIPQLRGMIFKAIESEAATNLGAIRRAELLLQQLTGKFVAAADKEEIKSRLELVLGDKYYTYEITTPSPDDFLAVATPRLTFGDWLKEVQLTKDTFTGGTFGYGGTSGSNGGGGGKTGGSSGGASTGGSVGGGVSVGGGGVSGIPSGPSSPSVVTLPTSGVVETPSIPVPTGVQTYVNDDGWVTIGWDQNYNNVAYRVFKADTEDGPFLFANDLFKSSASADESWEDYVGINKQACYQVTTVYQDSSGTYESEPSQPVCTTASAVGQFGSTASDAKTALSGLTGSILNVDGVTNGADLTNFLDAQSVPILFGRCLDNSGNLAYYNPVTNVIVLDVSYADAPKEIVACVLAHETMHRIWDEDFSNGPPYQYGVPNPMSATERSSNSVDQEYRSFLAEVQVWKEIKGGLIDPELDNSELVVATTVGCTGGASWCFTPEDEAKEWLVTPGCVVDPQDGKERCGYDYGYLNAY